MRKNGKFMGNQPKKDNSVGYCHSGQHQGYMTVRMIKCNGCLAKQCKYLEKYMDNPYWAERERIKAEKKAKKAELYTGVALA